MSKVHISAPEAETFLLLASDEVATFRRRHGRCPVRWSEVDITYANGPYRMTDADIRPRPEDGRHWRPRDTNYEYVLDESAGANVCRILAVDRAGKVELYIDAGTDQPVRPK